MMRKKFRIIAKITQQKLKTHSGPKKPWETSLTAVYSLARSAFLCAKQDELTKGKLPVNKKSIRTHNLKIKSIVIVESRCRIAQLTQFSKLYTENN
jgi:hypothetical protein